MSCQVQRISLLLLLVLVAAAFAPALWAQTQGTITGLVTDSSAAAVPRATVTVTNENTNVSRQAQTNDAGLYRFSSLTPGTYRVKVETGSFQSAIRSGIELQVQQTERADFQLKAGDVTQDRTSVV